MKRPLLIIFLVLLLDQAVKFWIKTHMYLGQEYHVLGDWFIIHFTENNGMAFGWEFAGNWGKLVLTTFRIFAVAGILYWLMYTVKHKAPKGLTVCIALIFAGAVGNIIDSVFYGRLFSSSDFELARFLPAEGGYAPWMYGKVVDMLYFPLLHGHFPSWFPFWGGEEFVFFRPVFNIADSAITIGVFAIILFQKNYFTENSDKEPATENTVHGTEPISQVSE